MYDGDVALGVTADVRPAVKALSDLKKKTTELFKGVDTSGFQAELKEIVAEIKKTEAEMRKAQSALNAIMSGEKDPQAVKELNAELRTTESEISKIQKQLDDIIKGSKTPQSVKDLENETKQAYSELLIFDKKAQEASQKLMVAQQEYADALVHSPFGMTEKLKNAYLEAEKNAKFADDQASRANEKFEILQDRLANLRQNPQLTVEAQQYQLQIDNLQSKTTELRANIETIRQNPELTEEARRYEETLQKNGEKLEILKARHEELTQQIVTGSKRASLANNSVVDGFKHLERRIIGLVKRVFIFSLITKALRGLRKAFGSVVSADTQLANSLAQIKGNLATAFGAIWTTILPAIRAFIYWIAKATRFIAQFISWLTGKSFKVAQEAMQSINADAEGTASNTGKIGSAAAKAAKKLQRMLMPFDQMNVLSKDAASSAGGGGGGGAGGGGAAGTIWPEDNDALIKKFEKLKDIILLIGAAFAAWKLSKILSALKGISRIKAFVGLMAIIYGITQLVEGIKSIIKDGPNFENVCQTIGGALLVVGGAALLAGAPWAAIVLIIGGVMVALSKLYKHSPKFKKFIDTSWEKLKEFKKRLSKAYSKDGFKGFFKELKAVGQEIDMSFLKWFATTKVGKAIQGFGEKIGKIIKKSKFATEVVKFGVRISKAFKEEGFKGVFKEVVKIGNKIGMKLIGAILKTKIGRKIFSFGARLTKAFKKDGFKGLFKEAGKIGKEILGGIFKGIWKAIKGVGKWIKKHIFDPIVKGIKKVFGIASPAKKMNDVGENIFKGILDGILNAVKGIPQWVKKHVFEPIHNALFGDGEDSEGFIVNIATKFDETKESLKQKWNNLVSGIEDKVAEVKATIKQKWSDIKDKWNELVENAKDKEAELKAKVASKWEDLKEKWNSLVENVKDKTADLRAKVASKWSDLKQKWNKLVSHAKDKTANLKAKVASKWSDLKQKWNNLVGNIKDKEADIKLKISTTLASVKQFIRDIIQGINAKLNTVKWPSWAPIIGGKNILPLNPIPLPALAEGAVIPANKKFLAILGDQKRGTNVETPLSTMIEAFNTALRQNGGGVSTVNVYLQGDAKQLFRVVRTEANNYTQSTGKAAFNL